MGKPLRQQDDDNQNRESAFVNEPNLSDGDATINEAPPARRVIPFLGKRSPTPATANAAGIVDEDRGLSFEQIHAKYQDKIYNLIFRYVGDADDAQDLTAVTFENAWKAWDRFRGDSKVSTWLYQIATNCCKNRFKQRDRQRDREPISLDDSFETDTGGEMSREVADYRYAPERLLLNTEMVEKVREAIDALPSEYRVVLILSQREEMSYEEIARITGLTVANVKTRIHRARTRVRQRLEPYYRSGFGKTEKP